jgi:hypothetical protein
MGQTAGKAQRVRAAERAARLQRARQRRLELDKDREAREARIDAAVADVYQAQDDKRDAAQVIELAEQRIGEALNQILGEGVPLARVAELTELSVTQLQRLRAVAAGETRLGPAVAPAGRPSGADPAERSAGDGALVRSMPRQARERAAAQ